jgi:hypothetical protein
MKMFIISFFLTVNSLLVAQESNESPFAIIAGAGVSHSILSDIDDPNVDGIFGASSHIGLSYGRRDSLFLNHVITATIGTFTTGLRLNYPSFDGQGGNGNLILGTDNYDDQNYFYIYQSLDYRLLIDGMYFIELGISNNNMIFSTYTAVRDGEAADVEFIDDQNIALQHLFGLSVNAGIEYEINSTVKIDGRFGINNLFINEGSQDLRLLMLRAGLIIKV